MRIDSHHHLWDLKAVHYPWLMAKGEVRFLEILSRLHEITFCQNSPPMRARMILRALSISKLAPQTVLQRRGGLMRWLQVKTGRCAKWLFVIYHLIILVMISKPYQHYRLWSGCGKLLAVHQAKMRSQAPEI